MNTQSAINKNVPTANFFETEFNEDLKLYLNLGKTKICTMRHTTITALLQQKSTPCITTENCVSDFW